MIELTSILTVLEMCAKVVEAYPEQYDQLDQPIRCLRPNTFAVLTSIEDVDANNLMKTNDYYDKGYFFSRDWKDSHYQNGTVTFSYPLIGCAIDFLQFSPKSTQRSSYRLNFFALSQKAGHYNGDDTTYCNTRTMERAHEDSVVMLSLFFQELSDFVYAELTKDGLLFEEGWYNKKYLESVKGTLIDFYEQKIALRDYISTNLASAEFFPNIHNDALCGLFTNVDFLLDGCIPNPLTFAYGTTTQLPDPILEVKKLPI